MRIGIIGYGYVGKAIAECYDKKDLVIRDPVLKNSADLSDFNNCDAIFVCVPSPSNHDGSCNTDILEQSIKELLFVLINKQIPIICKTTAPPSVYQKLHSEYSNIVHCPEFLTAANSFLDYKNANYFILGGREEWCVKAREVIYLGVPLVHHKFLITDIKTAAFFKYMMNSYLAAKVTFMNEFCKLADVEGVDWQSVQRLSSYDVRIGNTHMSVPGSDGKYGWGGACFPKDVSAIIQEAKSLNLDFTLLENIVEINKTHRNKNND